MAMQSLVFGGLFNVISREVQLVITEAGDRNF